MSNEVQVKNDLAHFGVSGMKWGVRKGSSSGSAKKTSGSEDYQSAQSLKKKGSKNLSTKELKDLTQRMQLEQQYKNLDPGKYKKGMDVVKAITAAGTTVASLYALSKTPLAQDIIKAMSKAEVG